MLETVAVVHNELNVGIYRLLADYFRFCGVSVFNCSVAEHAELEGKYEFDAVFIDETDSQHPSEPSQRQLMEEKLKGKAFFWLDIDNSNWNYLEEGKNYKNERIAFLQSIIGMLKGKSLLDNEDEDSKVLAFLAKLFVEKEIMKNRIILQTFLNVSSFIRGTRENFVNAYVALLKSENKAKWQDNSYFWFAQWYLEQSINESCSFLDEDMLLDTKKVVNAIEERIKLSDEHRIYQSCLYSAIAHFYECDFFEQTKSVEAWQNAYNWSKGSAFEFLLSYRLGRSYEKQLAQWDKAIDYYDHCLNIAHDEYRAVYKRAVYCWKQENDIESACEYFLRIHEILSKRYMENRLQPREAEYLYKAWHFIREIIRRNGDKPVCNITASYADERLREIPQSIQNGVGNPIYTLIFGIEAKIDSKDSRSPKADVRAALAERVQSVCTL